MKIQHHHPILFFLLFVILTLAVNSLSAQEINVLYTGETHAML